MSVCVGGGVFNGRKIGTDRYQSAVTIIVQKGGGSGGR